MTLKKLKSGDIRMKVYTDGQFDKKGGCVLALGSFDALHFAHIKLFCETVDKAKEYGVRAGVHLFDRRIENVIFPGSDHKSVYKNSKRAEIISETGMDFVYFEKFDKAFMEMSAFDFAKMLKDKFGAVCVVTGFHYSFGYMGSGGIDELKKFGRQLGFEVISVAPIMLDGELVSSTRVRECIKSGNIFEVNRLLGREYALCGKIISDRGVGSSMGMPTANTEISSDILLPKNGVYAAYVKINGRLYPAVTNIGIRPTFGLDKISVETHIIDFDGDLYGTEMEIRFLDRLRDEKKFTTKEDLLKQILSDINKTKQIFSAVLIKKE